MSPPLVLLPSGRWLDPADVSRIDPQPHMRQVLIVLRAGAPAIEDVPDGMDVYVFANRIGGLVNAARREATPDPARS